MKALKTIQMVVLSLGLASGGAVALEAQYAPPVAPGPDYPAPYGGGLRGLVDRAQSDLRAAEESEHNKPGQIERYDHTQGHLSSFDRKLTHGKFDKGELNKSIDGIKDILDKNVLTASSREALIHDIDDLKVARDRRW